MLQQTTDKMDGRKLTNYNNGIEESCLCSALHYIIISSYWYGGIEPRDENLLHATLLSCALYTFTLCISVHTYYY